MNAERAQLVDYCHGNVGQRSDLRKKNRFGPAKVCSDSYPAHSMGGELPVLPLSIPGSVSFAHIPENDSYLSGDSFFMYRFSKQQAGLGGMAFDEGTFGVFGYITKVRFK
eukprot:scaffold190816_cov21-Tisochrysis_lutea.AAC.2